MGSTSILHDITGRKEKEEQLRLAAKVFETSREGILITDADASIIHINQAFTKVTGYRLEEITGKNPKILQSGRQDKTFYQNMWKSLKEKDFWQGEIWNRRKSGELYVEWLSINVLRAPEGKVTHYLGIFSDITEKKQAEQKIAHIAHFDSLTDLPNRILFYEELKRKLNRTRQDKEWLAILYLDLDRFKEVNDLLGHGAGDQLLQRVARRLKRCIRPTDTLARLGGDEFCIIIGNLSNKDLAQHAAAQVVGKIKEATQDPIPLGEEHVTPNISIGIALYPQDAEHLTDLVRYADLAMYDAKAHNGTHAVFFSDEMNRALIRQVAMNKELLAGYQSDAFLLYYQPQIDFDGQADLVGNVSGFEALLRWRHPEEGMLLPANFIPSLERTGLINEVGEWVLKEACDQGVRWLHQGLSNFKIAVNLSVRQLTGSDFPEKVAKALHDSGLPATSLQLEITESLMIKDPVRIATLLCEMTDQGVAIALDDFGTGYASLSYLKRFPIQTIKIDQSFVQDITTDPDDAILVKTIINMANNLKLKVIAEGVETEAQRDFLEKNGCNEMQGHYYAKPMPAEAIKRWMAGR